MLDHRGFSAYITTNGLELVEFEPRINQQTHTVTCWIDGPVGQPFIVHWRDHGSKVDSASWIHVDGFKVSGQFLYGRGDELRRGVRVASEEERPFMFSAINHMDPHCAQGGRPADKNVGSIVLEIRLIKRVGEREPNPLRPPPNVVRGNRQPGEVAIRYGDVRPTSLRQRTFKIEPFDPKAPGPYVTFIFRYRTKNWLVSQGIVSDNEVTSRLLILPHVRECSKADLPPLECEEAEGPRSPVAPPASARRLSSRSSRAQVPPQASSSRLPSQPPVPPPGTVRMADLGLGHRPQAVPDMSRVSSTTSTSSFSGTWDPTPFNEPYEEWNEYRPEDLNDAINNYY